MPPVLSLPNPGWHGGTSTSSDDGGSFYLLEENFEDLCAKRRKLLHPPTEYPASSCLALEPKRPVLETTVDLPFTDDHDPEFQFVGFKKGKRIYRRVRPSSFDPETMVIRQPLVSAVGEDISPGDYWKKVEYGGFSPTILQSISENVAKEGAKPIATEGMCKPTRLLSFTTVPGFEIQNTIDKDLNTYGLSDDFIKPSKKYSSALRQARDSKQAWPTGSTGDRLDWKQHFVKSFAPPRTRILLR